MYLESRAVVAAAAVSVLAALAAVAGLSASVIVLAALDGILLVAGIVDVVTAPAPRTLRPAPRAPDALTVGEIAASVVHVANPTARPLEVAIRDAAPPSLRMTPLRQRAVIAPRSFGDVRAQISPAR